MIKQKVEGFSLHNNRGEVLLDRDLTRYRSETENGFQPFGPVVAYSWYLGSEPQRLSDPDSRLSIKLLPDQSGFIAFEQGLHPDNCLLLDGCGREVRRLAVPMNLLGRDLSDTVERWFRSIDGSYADPATGQAGKFGVSAWVESVGEIYLELDFRSGQFLWWKPIRV